MALSTKRDGTASMTLARKCPGDQMNILVRSSPRMDFGARGSLSAVSATHTTNVSIYIINLHSFLLWNDPFSCSETTHFPDLKFFFQKRPRKRPSSFTAHYPSRSYLFSLRSYIIIYDLIGLGYDGVLGYPIPQNPIIILGFDFFYFI